MRLCVCVCVCVSSLCLSVYVCVILSTCRGQSHLKKCFYVPKSSLPLLPLRNLRKGPSGLADEINFEDFLTIMSYFRPIDTTLGEEQVELSRKEKLKCMSRVPASPNVGTPQQQEARPSVGGREMARGHSLCPYTISP